MFGRRVWEWSLLLLWLLCLPGISQQQTTIGYEPIALDIVICLDSSGSISHDDYAYLKQAVLNFTLQMPLGENSVWVGVRPFSRTVSSAHVAMTWNRTQLEEETPQLPHLGRNTHTDVAIEDAINTLFIEGRGNDNVARAIVVVTDGVSTYPSETAREAERARDRGIGVFAVGMGDAISRAGLLAIANKEEDTFMNSLNLLPPHLLNFATSFFEAQRTTTDSNTGNATGFTTRATTGSSTRTFAGTNTGTTGGTFTGSSTGSNTETTIGTDTRTNAGTFTGTTAETNTGTTSGTDTGTTAGTDTETSMGINTGTTSRTTQPTSVVSNTDISTIANTGTNAGTTPGTNTETTSGTTTGISKGTTSGTSTGTTSWTTSGTTSRTNTGTTSGTNTGTTSGTSAGTTSGTNTGTTSGTSTGTTSGTNTGTTSRNNAGTTSGTSAGTTSGTSAGTTSGTNAGTTSGTSKGTTSGTNTGTTSGTNAGTTSGTNTGTTSGTNAGTTSGTNTGTTSGTNTGTTSGTSTGTASGTNSGTTPGTNTGTTSGTTPGTTTGTTSGTTSGTTPGTDDSCEEYGQERDFSIGYSGHPVKCKTWRPAGVCGGPGVRVVDGVGYASHPFTCDHYVQCYPGSDRAMTAVTRRCPLGQLWNHGSLTCEDAAKVTCSMDKCAFPFLRHHNMVGNCRTFWTCQNGRSVPACCPEGHAYFPGRGCEPCANCHDACPSTCHNQEACPYRSDPSSPASYAYRAGVLGWMTSTCLVGVFDIVSCTCTISSLLYSECTTHFEKSFKGRLFGHTDVETMTILGEDNPGLLFEESKIIAPLTFLDKVTRTADRPVRIRMRYMEWLPLTASRDQMLLQSSPCDQGGLLVLSIDSVSLAVRLWNRQGLVVDSALSLQGFERTSWKDLELHFAASELRMSVTSGSLAVMASIPVADKVTVSDCGWTFVHPALLDDVIPFTGALDYVDVSYC